MMLICTCSIDEKCPALGSHCECFPWCEYLKEDGIGERSLLFADLDEIIDATDGKGEGE
jgi:hypothetical protein